MGCGASSSDDSPSTMSRPLSITLLASSKNRFAYNYELISMIGKGATSEVYSGMD